MAVYLGISIDLGTEMVFSIHLNDVLRLLLATCYVKLGIKAAIKSFNG